MSVTDGLIFKGERIVIPNTLQAKALQAIHRSHMGIQKTLDRSKGCFYWSGISKVSGYHADTPITIKAEPFIWPTAALINIHEHPI